MSELTQLTLSQLAVALEKREASSLEVTSACLQRIDRVDGSVGAFLRVDEAGALAAARASDERRAEGRPQGALDGVPVALKDNILTEGVETTAGSRMLKGFVPPYDAEVTRRLKAAGAVLLGKCNLDEFAMGSSTQTSAFQLTRNPYDVKRTPGGSSGGSAAAVAARFCFGALGSDTGGSIRQPAAFTNTVGLKPTWGRVSRRGVVAFASSLDQVGPFARTVEDAAHLLEVLAGHDPGDATCADVKVGPYLQGLEQGVKGLRVGVVREGLGEGLDAEVAQAARDAEGVFARLGATVKDVSLPHAKHALAAYYVIAPCEASSNLGRYDGVRYGHHAKDAKGIAELITASRSEGFGPEVQRRILLGTFALSAGYHDAYYVKAQRVRTLIRRDFEAAFEQCDVLLTPTSPVPPFLLGEKLDSPLSMYLMDVLTLPASLAGVPGVSVPGGFTTGGLPIGLQLVGRPFDEATVLRVARAFERETNHHARAPGV